MSETGILAEAVPGAACPLCGGALPAAAEPLSEVVCPACGKTVLVPGRLGQYRLDRLLGKGGMGAVYEGFDEGLRRKVAVKVILRDKAAEDPTFITRFQQEAQAAARLNHPNIVGVYAFGEFSGQPYLVMELVQPQSLDRMMQDGPVNADTALRIGRQIADGLRAASDQGLVHGDVKPENILINAAHEAKLADFGIAALVGANAAANHEVWGTPYYIAPETLRRQKVDARADIYSLGATLYHAIAGVPPFEGADAVEVMKARLTAPARPLRTVMPSCPEPIAKIVMRMLEAEPIRRYPNYASLLGDMDKELQAGKSRTAAGKRIVLKGKTQAVPAAGPSRPMPSVKVNPNAPLFPEEQRGMSKGAIIGLAIGLGGGAVVLIGAIVAVLVMLARKDRSRTPDVAPAVVVAQAEDPAAVQAEADRRALAALSESVAACAAETKGLARAAETTLKTLAKQAERAVLPEHRAWLERSSEPAPTALLKTLQEAFAQAQTLEQAASGADVLRTQVDGLRVQIAEQSDPAQVAEALKTAQAAVAAWKAAPEAKAARANAAALERLAGQWRKTVDRGRAEMERLVAQRFAEEQQAKAEAARAAEAERLREAAAAEVASVSTMETAAGAELDRFDPEAAAAVFEARAARLKSAEARAAAEKVRRRIRAFARLKAWLVAGSKAGAFAGLGVASATPEAVVMGGKSVQWKDFVADQQGVAFRMFSNWLADDAGARALKSQERAELAVSARLYVTRYFGAEMLEKSKALRAMMDKLKAVAEALPGTRAELAELEGVSEQE